MRAFSPRRTTRTSRCLSALFAFGLVLGPASVAHAEEPAVGVERPVMYFGFDPDPGRHLLCGNGFLRQPPAPSPTWTLTVYGARSNATLISGSDADGAQNGFVCVTVDKHGAPYGSYTAVFRYDSLPDDLPSQIVAHVAWYPGREGTIASTEQ